MTLRSPHPAGVVLCGGASRRMGRDKALLGDPPWAHRVASILGSAGCRPVTLLGGDPVLADGLWEQVPDRSPGAGPAAALCHAAALHRGGTLVVAACDLPRLSVEAVRTLVGECMGAASTTAYAIEGRPQWSLLALPLSETARLAAVHAEGHSLTQVLGGGTRLLEPDDPSTVTDLDTPDDAGAAVHDRVEPSPWSVAPAGSLSGQHPNAAPEHDT